MDCDLISKLPDHLITHMLSLMDMKDVVKTSVLSKRWELLWTQVDNIIFDWVNDKVGDGSKELLQFIAFVDKTLMQCTCPNINTFSLSVRDFEFTRIGCTVDIYNPLNKWLEFVLNKNVKRIKLGEDLVYKGQCCFYQSSSLERVELDAVYGYYKTDYIAWPFLRSLSLKDVHFDEQIMGKLLMGCPILETLVLDMVRGLRNINITSPNLKILKLINLQYDEPCYDSQVPQDDEFNCMLKIQVPWVEKLEITGLFVWIECQLVDVSSLKYADLTFCYSYDDSEREEYTSSVWRNMVSQILKQVCHVDKLVIGSDLIQAMSVSKMSGGPNLEFKCKNLTLHSHTLCQYELPGIVSLLQSMPLLETLVVEMSAVKMTEYETFDFPPWHKHLTKCYKKKFSFNGADYLMWKSGSFDHLKSVKIDYTSSSTIRVLRSGVRGFFELEFVAFVLRNAPFVERLVILPTDRATPYYSLMSSKFLIGNKARSWEGKRKRSMFEFSSDDNK